MPANKNTLGRFVFEKCYDEIFGPLAAWICAHPGSLKKRGSHAICPGAASLKSIRLQFTTNVFIASDSVSFDAVISCEIALAEWSFEGWWFDTTRQWYRVSCTATVEDTIKEFAVHHICTYSRMPESAKHGVADNNLVPVLSAKDFEAEATRFLEEYCPEALVTPMPVPIEMIVREKMGLPLIKNGCLDDDQGIFGEIHFTPGMAKVYDLLYEGTEDVTVKRGTILVDAMTSGARNLGCVNNTIAHEAIHWFLHRVYAAVQSIRLGGAALAYRCQAKPARPYGSEAPASWSDEDRMEWQANNIAPRILMPAHTFKLKVEEFYAQYGYHDNASGQTAILERVIRALAEFFHVSKQSARIRMEELGLYLP